MLADTKQLVDLATNKDETAVEVHDVPQTNKTLVEYQKLEGMPLFCRSEFRVSIAYL